MRIAKDENGHEVEAGPEAPKVARCPSCGSVVYLRSRRGFKKTAWFWRHDKSQYPSSCPDRARKPFRVSDYSDEADLDEPIAFVGALDAIVAGAVQAHRPNVGPRPLSPFKWFQSSPDAGDPACLCSSCDQLIGEDEIPVRLFRKAMDLEARFHQACFEKAIEAGWLVLPER